MVCVSGLSVARFRARGASGWQHPFCVARSLFSLRLSALRLPSFYLEAKRQWLSFLLQNSGAQASRERSSLPSPGGGGSRPEGTRGGVRGDAGICSARRALSPQPAALRASTFPLRGRSEEVSASAGAEEEERNPPCANAASPIPIAEISRSENEIMSATRAFFVGSTFSSKAARFRRHDMTTRAAPYGRSMAGFARDKAQQVRGSFMEFM